MKLRLALIPAALLIAVSLTSCSDGTEAETTAAETDTACAASGSVSEAVTVTGDFGDEITITSDTPVEAETLERSVIETGDGAEITEKDDVFVSVHVFNGSTGNLIETNTSLLNQGEEFSPWVKQSMSCSNLGDRVVVVVPATEVFGDGNIQESGVPELTEDDSLIIVSDYKELLLDKAEGKAQTPPAGAPEVELDESGEPTITIPDGEKAPNKLTIHPLIEGEGDEVNVGDTVYVHYRGVIWGTGEEFDSSWSRGSFTSFPAATPEENNGNGVIGGFRDALVGQKVGSQIMSIVPAEDGGYGAEGLESQGHKPDDVMVFVLDILGAVPAAQ